MTLTITNYEFRDKWMQCLVRRATYTGPSIYATGGEAINNANDFGWGNTHTLQGIISNGTTFYALFLDYANQKVQVVDMAAGTEISNGTDLDGFSGQIVATGH